MKQRILDLYNSKKVAIWWTAGYVFCTYLILKLLFNFSIFSAENWSRLARAHLYGFPGFVFGILILAMVPLYVATTTIVIRTGKPLFTIPLPKLPAIFKKEVEPAPVPEPAPEPSPDVIKIEDVPSEMPNGMPAEMRAPYMRARKYGTQFPIAQPVAKNDTPTADAETPRPGELPIPTDFDFDMPTPSNNAPSFDTPVFSDINFGDDDDDVPTIDETIPTPDFNSEDTNENIAPVIEFLKSIGRDFSIEDDIVITDGFAIASHTDTDFWIADEASWFAAGKSRPSPIIAVRTTAAAHNVTPVMYMGATNIMDIDTRRAEWESLGVNVTTNLNSVIS